MIIFEILSYLLLPLVIFEVIPTGELSTAVVLVLIMSAINMFSWNRETRIPKPQIFYTVSLSATLLLAGTVYADMIAPTHVISTAIQVFATILFCTRVYFEIEVMSKKK